MNKHVVMIVASDGQRSLRLYPPYPDNSGMFVSVPFKTGDLIATAANISENEAAYSEEKSYIAESVSLADLDLSFPAISFAILVTAIESIPEEELSDFSLGAWAFGENPWHASHGCSLRIAPGEIKGDTKFVFPSLYDAILYDGYELNKTGTKPVRCQNCGKLFFPHSRSDEIYCDHIFKNGKTCKAVGYQRKIEADEIKRKYRQIYKTQNARKQRNSYNPNIEARFTAWTKYAKKQLEACQSGKISLAEMSDRISGSGWITQEPSSSPEEE